MSTPTTNYGLIKAAEGEQYDVDITNNNLDAIDTQIKARQNFDDLSPLGLLYKAFVATSSGIVTNSIINNIPTFTFKANRNYRIVWDFSHWASGNSDSLFWCSIQRAAVGDAASLLTGLTPIAGRTKGLITSYALQSTQYNGAVTAYYNPGGADVTTQIKFRVEQVLGDDGLVVIGNPNENATYLIYDDGKQV